MRSGDMKRQGLAGAAAALAAIVLAGCAAGSSDPTGAPPEIQAASASPVPAGAAPTADTSSGHDAPSPSVKDPRPSTEPPAPRGTPSQPRDLTWSIVVGNTERTFRVHVPTSYDPGAPIPVRSEEHTSE